MTTGWEDRAAGWIALARTPGHDNHRTFRASFFELVPPPGGRALEIGCGEGRVCRDLRERGHDVTGLDASPTLVEAARELDPGGEYVVAAAEALPCADATFDLVVAYNALMDVDDMPVAVHEAARVLTPAGRLCVCVTHPFCDAGTFASREPGAPFVLEKPYLEEGSYELTTERDGLTFTWSSRTYPVQSYTRALESAGLLVEALLEPVGVDDRDRRRPQFLHLRARRRADATRRATGPRIVRACAGSS